MKIEIITPDFKNDLMVRQFVEQKVRCSLSRIEPGVQTILVQIENMEPDGGSVSWGCLVEVELCSGTRLESHSRGESGFDCVLQAIQKLEKRILNSKEAEVFFTHAY